MTSTIETERLHRKRQVALAYRLFAALRWGDTGDGHITARDPDLTDCFWLLRYMVSFDQATVGDLVLVDASGAARDLETGEPTNERINTAAYHIHHPIHAARPEVVAAAHVHTQWGTPFSAERRLLTPITQEATIFFDDHRLFDDDEVQIQSLDGGKRIAAALADTGAVILANHGLLTVGATVGETIAKFVLMERVAEAHLKAPAAQPIGADAARFARTDLVRDGLLGEVFDFLIARHVGDIDVVG